MPAPICIMASVMMKDGMPISVMPARIDQAEQRSRATSARMIAAKPGSGTLAMFT